MTAGGDYMAEIGANLAEKHQVAVSNQGHATTYASAAGHQSWSVTPSQHSHQMYYGSTENGYHSNISYHCDQQKNTTISTEALNGTDTTLNAPNTSFGAPATQDYSGYATYPYSTDSYVYGSSEYPNHYYAYQQAGQGQNSGAPYQPLSSFQNASPASYSGTYYNAGDYQTSSGYQTTTAYQPTSCGNQSNVWNGGIGGSYPPYDYSSYTAPDTSATHNTSTAPGYPHYQQQYSQWGGYYTQTASSDVLCAPGTENLTTNNPSVENSTINSSGGYPYASNQPPPPGTTPWKQNSTSFGLPPQGIKDNAGYNQTGGWQAGHHVFQNQHVIQATSSTPSGSSHFLRAHPEDQQKPIYPQSSNLQFSLTNQVSQSLQTPTQAASMADASQTSRMQIPTNPRIATNLVVSMPKTEKESITIGATLKPAYISVAAPKLNNREATHGSSDNMKGTLPPCLRAYVERTFARCKNDSQRAANQNIMKEMITNASMDGTLLTRNWDVEPLFPLPNAILETTDNNTQISASIPPLAKHRSPNRRTKSRWEPVPEEKLAESLQSVNHFSVKGVAWDNSKDNKKLASFLQANTANHDFKQNGWNKTKFVPAQQQTLSINNTMRPLKRQRFDDSNSAENGDASSGSDKEQGLTKYYSSAITLANSPEERKKREHRVKRFEKGHDHQSESKSFRMKGTGAGTLYTRRSNVLLLAKDYEDSTNEAVEDIDWDSLTVKGTCQEIEKRYLRLTSAPDPATVRPEEVLEKALVMVQSSQKNYLYKCDQLKSIRQDLTVQRIWNELTAKVYETHARLALEAGDLSEYNQCQSQLKTLYSEGIQGCHWEFSAYNLLCVILHSSNNRELLSSMARLSAKAKDDDAVKHALAVRAAVTSGNYVLFFRLYKKAPNLSTCLMDLYVEKMRFEAVKCMCKSYRPTVPIVYIAQVLGFSTDALEECDDWLRMHGAILTTDNNGEMQLDTKASSSTLYMPEPEDAVAHGDTSLAVDDFLTRTS